VPFHSFLFTVGFHNSILQEYAHSECGSGEAHAYNYKDSAGAYGNLGYVPSGESMTCTTRRHRELQGRMVMETLGCMETKTVNLERKASLRTEE
jgi:hypothetical protein